ncbi:MAG: aspartate 1-decarboxylase [Campylobacteraceae bacterium]|jgi:aspartate 1-decarboxylase|nr:aspartate 1-decarboxylase [Campylobacteraceae bacterium]
MMFEMLYSKIHRATVTDANLNYVGSITIDRDLIDAANLKIGQKVDVVNINNGERISTYVIEGKRGSNIVCLNGAAARKVQIGDKVIIISYVMVDEKELSDFKPYVILVDEKNCIVKKEESI